MFKYLNKTTKITKLLLILIIFSTHFNVYSIKIFPHLFYKIKGKLECLKFIPSVNSSYIPHNVQITPIANAQVELWDEDGNFYIWCYIKLELGGNLGMTLSHGNGWSLIAGVCIVVLLPPVLPQLVFFRPFCKHRRIIREIPR